MDEVISNNDSANLMDMISNGDLVVESIINHDSLPPGIEEEIYTARHIDSWTSDVHPLSSASLLARTWLDEVSEMPDRDYIDSLRRASENIPYTDYNGDMPIHQSGVFSIGHGVEKPWEHNNMNKVKELKDRIEVLEKQVEEAENDNANT